MTINEMKEKKKEKGYSYAKIAELSGVPLGTVQKIFSGETESPRYDTLTALEQVFNEQLEVRESGGLYKARMVNTLLMITWHCLMNREWS